MLDNLIGFLFSALLGVALVVVVVVMARNAMVRDQEKRGEIDSKPGDSEMRGAPGSEDRS